MVDLPRELQPWADPLGLFGDAVHDAVGRWLLPMRALVGPMSVPRAAHTGDPDGFSGLARRGPYDRLLLSEWAIALEVPDEFLRRAIMGEHMFMAPAFVEPHGASTSVALLDAGPMQLGSPRLVHLAALIVLQQRAADTGATFRFGVLQDSTATLRTLTRESITTWIKARSWQPPSVGVPAWSERIAELEPEDLWLVGDTGLLEAANRMRGGLLEVGETETTPTRVRVQAHRARSVGGVVELGLPDPEDSIRILRRPLSHRRTTKLAAGELCVGVRGQLSRNGRRLFVRRDDGWIDAVHVPNTPADVSGRARQIYPVHGGMLVAADLFGGRLVALDIDRHGLLVLRGAGFASTESRSVAHSITTVTTTGLKVPESLALTASDRPSLATMYVVKASVREFEAWIWGLEGELWQLRLLDGNPASLTIRDRRCRHLCRLDTDYLAWVSESECTVLSTSGRVVDGLALAPEELARVVFGNRHGAQAATFGYATESGQLQVFRDGSRDVEYETGPGTVIGLRTQRYTRERPEFFVLDSDRRAVRKSGCAPMFAAPSRIQELVYEPSCGRIVAQAECGTVQIYSIDREAVLLSVTPQGGPR